MLGVGLKGDMGKRLCILVNLDLQGLQADFEEVKVEGASSPPTKVSHEQSISLVTFAAGLGYRF